MAQSGKRLQPAASPPDPAAFWAAHVVPRVPGLFPVSPDLAHLPGLWTDAYLTAAAGGARVEVEQRGGGAGEGFGKGHKAALSFGEALRRMAAGDSSLYLTTQAVELAPDGHPHLYASPVAELASDVPLLPRLMAPLVPQSVNLWAGAAREGSSTGLHVDFHDNMYVLLRGRKRFRLYPPSTAPKMYTVGRIAGVHPNGRIVFEGQGDVLADGSEASDARQWLARHRAERELAAAEAAVEQGLQGAAKQLRAAERRLDAVLEASLGDGEDWADDFDTLQNEPELLPTRPATAGDPESFSRVDLALPDAELKRRFPRFPGKAAAVEVEVGAGQMLYLPAGWFHEVTSFSAGASPVHMALNFWYHPPDNLAGGAAQARRRPYASEFWPAVWEGRRAEYEARHRQPEGGSLAEAEEEEQRQHREDAAPATVPRRSKLGAAAAAADGRGKRPRLAGSGGGVSVQLPGTFGLFGVGRRSHLHRFVTGRL